MKITRGVQTSPQKVVLYGPEGIGKSTFGAQFPAPLFLDVEAGTKHIDVARIDPPPISWTSLLETVREFLRERPAEFATLVLDTADWAEQMCVRHVCDNAQKKGIEDFGYGKGYVYVAEAFGELLNLLGDVVAAGYNVVILAHAKMRKFEQPDEMGAYDRWEMKLSRNVAPLVKEWADMVLFANYKTMVITTGKGDNLKAKAQGQGKRVLYTTHHSCWDAKNRHGLPDEVALDFGQIAHCIPAGNAAQISNVPAPQSPAATAPNYKEATRGILPNSPPESTTLNKGGQEAEQRLEPEAAPVAYAGPDVPPALAQLMEQSRVTEEEVRQVIGNTGHFAGDTPWTVLQEQGYVDGYIIPQWEYFVTTIEADPDRLPF